MKKILLYSSKTGNTKKIADSIQEALICDRFEEITNFNVTDVNDDDFLIIGGWIDKGLMNKEVMDFIYQLKGKKVAFFFTLGAYPNSMHAFDCIENIKKAFVDNNNEVIAHYHCQGAIDPKLINWMSSLPADHSHSPDQDRINRWSDAKEHPNQEDLNSSKNFASTIKKKLGEVSV
ncbi:MAG: flavodoxin family protein [Anaerorhabdus sp.]